MFFVVSLKENNTFLDCYPYFTVTTDIPYLP